MFKYFLVLVCLFACSSSNSKNELVVGLQADYPPYEYVDESGKVVGFDIDVAQQIAESMGKKLVIKEMGFDALILSLKSHKIDLIISGMSITSDRLKEIDMVPYHGDQVKELQLVSWKTDKCIEDLKGKIVVAQTGTFQEQILRSFKQVQPKLLDNTQELVMEIKYGKADAALVETAVAKVFKEKFPEIQMTALMLSSDQQALGNGIGIAKDRPELKKEVEKSLKKEIVQKLQRKWFYD